MAKFLKRDATSGVVTEEATATTGGTGDALKVPSLDAQGRLTAEMMPVGIGADNKVVPASEALSAYDLVNLWDDAGTLKARKADAATAKQADGYVVAALSIGADATVYFDGQMTGMTSLTVGARYYLSDSAAGGVTLTPVSGAGKMHQYIGKALSATELTFEADDGIILA